jgi:hypothetical protein
MKKLFKFIFYFFVFIVIINYAKRNDNSDSLKTDFIETSQTKSPDVVYDKKSVSSNLRNKANVNNQIIIKSLGVVDDGDLEFAANIVRDFYKWNIVFESGVNIDISMLNKDGHLQTINTFDELIKTNSERTLFITDKLLYDHNDVLLRGAAFGDYLVVVRGEKRFMEETIIHEIGHLLGLDHCDNLSCIMAINNDDWETGDFCKECMNKINY